MLNRSGDLIPVTEEAKEMKWTNRSSNIVNFLHHGPVSFSTLVYDTKVGDIATVASYFNPAMVTVEELNTKYTKRMDKIEEVDTKYTWRSYDVDEVQDHDDKVQAPKLLIYPGLLHDQRHDVRARFPAMRSEPRAPNQWGPPSHGPPRSDLGAGRQVLSERKVGAFNNYDLFANNRASQVLKVEMCSK